jgi:hypothetical protein
LPAGTGGQAVTGTGTALHAYRAMPAEMIVRTYYANQAFYDELLAGLRRRHRLLADPRFRLSRTINCPWTARLF